jgi:hypothetical protein
MPRAWHVLENRLLSQVRSRATLRVAQAKLSDCRDSRDWVYTPHPLVIDIAGENERGNPTTRFAALMDLMGSELGGGRSLEADSRLMQKQLSPACLAVRQRQTFARKLSPTPHKICNV